MNHSFATKLNNKFVFYSFFAFILTCNVKTVFAQNKLENLDYVISKTQIIFHGFTEDISDSYIKFCDVEFLYGKKDMINNCIFFDLKHEKYPSLSTPIFVKNREYVIFVSKFRGEYTFTSMGHHGVYLVGNDLIYDYYGNYVKFNGENQLSINSFKSILKDKLNEN